MTRSGLAGTRTAEISNNYAMLERCGSASRISVRHRFHFGNTHSTPPRNAVPSIAGQQQTPKQDSSLPFPIRRVSLAWCLRFGH